MGKRDDVPAVQKAQEVLDYFAGVNREQMSDIERDACQLAEAVLRAPASEGEAVRSALMPNLTGRDKCVDVAMDYIDNSIEHVEECKSNTRDANDERHDCDCAVGDGLRELERLARLATHPAPATVTEAERIVKMLEGKAWVQAMLEAEALEMLKYFGAHDLHSNKDYKAAAEGFASRVAVALATNSATETVAGASNAVEKLHDLAQQMSGNPYATMYSHILTEIAESIATHPAPATVTEAMVEAGAKALVVGVNGLTEKGWENKDGDSWIEAVKAQAKKEMREVLLAALGGAR